MSTRVSNLSDCFRNFIARNAMFAPAVLATVVAAVAFQLADHQRAERLEADQRTEVAQQLASIAARLQTNLNGDVMLLQGVVAGIAIHPRMDGAEYAKLTSQVLQTPSQLKIITTAPDMVVKWVYPQDGNEKVIGLDYRTNTQQHDGAFAARNSHNVVLVGPVNLVQGGVGFIARCPVYVNEGRSQTFWGLVSGVVDTAKLYADSGITSTELKIAISRSPDAQSATDVFFGDAATFQKSPVFATLDMGYGRWTIAGIPQEGWGHRKHIVIFRLAAAAVCLAVILPMYWAGKLTRARQKTIAILSKRERDLVSARQTLEYQSLHDPLTGLLNRRFLDQLLTRAHAPEEEEGFSLIHVDLDSFKEVNDSRGHAGGDEVLRVTAGRLKEVIGHNDMAMRIGGDEFVVAVRDRSPPEANSLARAIVAALSAPIVIDGIECRIGASAGVASHRQAGNMTHLLADADLALYAAKKGGRGRAEIFTAEMRAAAAETKRLGEEFEAAIERSELIPYFQPQFDAVTHAIVGAEALARWDHPERGLLVPMQFLSIAEGLNKASLLDQMILGKALFELSRWDAAGISVPRISVNVSAQRLSELSLRSELAAFPFQHGRLCFELLESISFDGQNPAFEAALSNIKDLGVEIEIDDFGTGHASILSLLQLQPRRLKIDRQIVAPILNSSAQRRLVSSIIEIGRSQNIEIIAEGVETMEYAAILRDLGCHILQGYAFARPMSSDQMMMFCGKAAEARLRA